MRLYGKPSYFELEKALLHLSEPMDRNMPIKVMLKGIEDVQMFLLANEEEGREMTDTNLISYGLIKVAKTGGMYTKALERWHLKPANERTKWTNFRAHMIEEYKKLLAQGSGITMGQEGYGTAYTAAETEETDDTSLTESIVHFAK